MNNVAWKVVFRMGGIMGEILKCFIHEEANKNWEKATIICSVVLWFFCDIYSLGLDAPSLDNVSVGWCRLDHNTRYHHHIRTHSQSQGGARAAAERLYCKRRIEAQVFLFPHCRVLSVLSGRGWLFQSCSANTRVPFPRVPLVDHGAAHKSWPSWHQLLGNWNRHQEVVFSIFSQACN